MTIKAIRTIAAAALAAVAVAVASVSLATASDTDTEQKDIVDTAIASGKFDTLAALLGEAELVEALRGEGPFTVFAPTDAAFEKVPDKTLEELGQDKEKLRAVLLYHVVNRRLPARKLVKRRSVKTMNGQSLRIRGGKKTVKVNRARVVTADVGASNGVIHVINKVLIPR